MTVKSVQRALTILNLFSQQITRLGIMEISEALNITKGAAHGLVSTLAEAGFLYQEPETRKYRLGLKALEIGMMQPDAVNISRCAAGPANSLTHAKKMVTRVGLWDGEAVTVIAVFYPQERPEISSSLGPRIHAYASSLGKAILAHRSREEVEAYLKKVELKPFTTATITNKKLLLQDLEEARKKGFAIDREESAYGMACIGAPLYDKRGDAIGALSISSSPARIIESNQTENLARALLAAAGEISRSLSYG